MTEYTLLSESGDKFSCRTERLGEADTLALLFSGFDRGLFGEVCAASDFDGALAEFGEIDWDTDYSPWEAEGSGGRHFGGGADRLVRFIPQLIGELEGRYGAFSAVYFCGYSLGGVFALYAASVMRERVTGAASCSGSMWFPGFIRYLEAHPLGGKIYLSLGGKEKNSPDPMMASVEQRTTEARRIISKTADVTFVHEAGGHFSKIPQRICRAISCLSKSV